MMSPDGMIICGDASVSSTSTYGSVEDTINTLNDEKNRRMERSIRIRHQRSDISNQPLMRCISIGSKISFSSDTMNTSRGIMSVRTLKESLEGGKLVTMRRKRRNLKLKLSKERLGSVWSNISSFERDIFVQFSCVMVREYPIIPGDNPAVTDGPPLALDWTANNIFSVKINKFERFREGKRRRSLHMKMPMSRRITLLMDQDFDVEKIVIATREAAAIRNQRLQTIASLTYADTEERFENIRRSISKPFMRKQNKEEEEIMNYMKSLSCV